MCWEGVERKGVESEGEGGAGAEMVGSGWARVKWEKSEGPDAVMEGGT